MSAMLLTERARQWRCRDAYARPCPGLGARPEGLPRAGAATHRLRAGIVWVHTYRRTNCATPLRRREGKQHRTREWLECDLQIHRNKEHLARYRPADQRSVQSARVNVRCARWARSCSRPKRAASPAAARCCCTQAHCAMTCRAGSICPERRAFASGRRPRSLRRSPRSTPRGGGTRCPWRRTARAEGRRYCAGCL